MRRRERWAGLTWVSWMEGDSEGGAIPAPGKPPMRVGEAMHILTHHYKRYVEMYREGDSYAVRVLPMHREAGEWALDVGLSYIGTCLGSIMTCALVDLDLLSNGQVAHRTRAEEKQRWVS